MAYTGAGASASSPSLPSPIRFCGNAAPQGTIQAMTIERITLDPQVMGGKPCIRGMRVTVGTVVGLVAAGRTPGEILAAYPYLEAGDIPAALTYAAWRPVKTVA